MKKGLKIFLVMLSVALLAGVIGAIAASAATGEPDLTNQPEGAYYAYVNTSGSTVFSTNEQDLKTVITNAKTGTTVYVLRDVTYNTSRTVASGDGNADRIEISKALTIDLRGNKLLLNQDGKNCAFQVKTASEVRFKNGTLAAGYDDGAATKHSQSKYTTSKSFATFYNTTKVNVVLENITSYSGEMFCHYDGAGSTYTVIGGEHHITHQQTDGAGGFIESRTNITFLAEGATFYCTAGNGGLISSESYKRTTTPVESTFTFNNCKVLGDSPDMNLVVYANNHTKINFNNCKLYGSIHPAMHGNDKDYAKVAITNPVPGCIKLGAGTVVSAGSTYSDAVVLADGCGFVPNNETLTETLKVESGYVGDGTFTTVSKSVSCDYALKIADVTDASFEYFDISGNKLYGLGDTTVLDVAGVALNTAPIKLLRDHTLDISEIKKIENALNLDLNGFTLKVIQREGAYIEVATGAEIYIYGGKVVSSAQGSNEIVTDIPEFTPVVGIGGSQTSGKAAPGSPLFVASTDGVNIIFEGVDTYVSSLVYSSFSNTSVVINGGEHHVIYESELGDSTFLASDGSMSAKLDGAKIFVSEKNSLVSGTGAYASFDFDGCTVVAEAVENSLINNVNVKTDVTFTASLVWGSIAPTEGEPDNGTVILREGTRVGEGATLASGIVSVDDGYESVASKKTESISFAFSEGSLIGGDFTVNESVEKDYVFNSYVKKFVKSTVTVTWYKEDGKTVITSYEVNPGDVVTPPVYTATAGTGNGWYTTTAYDGWATSVGGSKVDDFTVNVATDFYPAYSGEITEQFTAGMYNLTFYGSVGVNMYVPYYVPEGITVNGVYSENGTKLTGVGKRIEGVAYTEYVIGKIGVAEITTPITVRIDYTVGEKALSKTITLDPEQYVNTVLEDSKKVATGTNVYPEAAHVLIADLVRYSNALHIAVNAGTSNAKLDTILQNYGSLCSELPTPTSFTQHTTSAKGLETYVESVSFAISKDQPRYVLNFKSGSKVTGATFTVQGFLEEETSALANFGTKTYGLSATSVYDGDYLTVAYSKDIPVYNIDRDVTITLTLEGGATVSGTYSINEYYSGMSATGTDRENYREFLRALRAFANTGSGYRYPAGELTGGAVCEFWDCSHENLGRFSYTDGRLCLDCATHVFFYKDYGAVGDGIANEFNSINAAHVNANAYVVANPDAKVGVVAGKGSVGSTFMIGMTTGAIKVNTDTDWSNVTFIFDDRLVPQDSAPSKQAVFELASQYKSESYLKNISSVAAGATNIGYAPGKPMLVYLVNSSVKHYFRYGANASNGQNRQEVILVDEFGNVDPSTPVEWAYEKLTTATAYPAYDKPITVSGLDDNGEISCTIITKANHDIKTPGYVSTNRGITISRSNSNISGIYHELHEIHEKLYDSTNSFHVNYNQDLIELGYDVRPMSEIIAGQVATSALAQNYVRRTAYTGIQLTRANGVIISDISVENHVGRDDDVGTDIGSYEFSGGTSANVAYVRCVSRNLFNDHTGMGHALGEVYYRGLFGTNYMRNMYFNECSLNSMDAHSGAYNVTIENSEFEHMNFIGGGDIIIKNTIAYVDGAAGVVRLRSDYGSSWHGDVYIDGLEIRHDSDCGNGNVSILQGAYTDHNFGPDGYTYMPTNVYMNNVSVVQYTWDATGITSTKKSSKSVYFYYNMYSKKRSDVTTRTEASDGTVTGNNYVPTSNVVVTDSSVTWKWTSTYIYDYILEGMNVTVNGSTVTTK